MSKDLALTKIKSTRYYGELYGRVCDGRRRLHFVVKLIAPTRAHYSEYIGKRNQKLSDLLCLDDTILASIEHLTIDWSEVQNV